MDTKRSSYDKDTKEVSSKDMDTKGLIYEDSETETDAGANPQPEDPARVSYLDTVVKLTGNGTSLTYLYHTDSTIIQGHHPVLIKTGVSMDKIRTEFLKSTKEDCKSQKEEVAVVLKRILEFKKKFNKHTHWFLTKSYFLRIYKIEEKVLEFSKNLNTYVAFMKQCKTSYNLAQNFTDCEDESNFNLLMMRAVERSIIIGHINREILDSIYILVHYFIIELKSLDLFKLQRTPLIKCLLKMAKSILKIIFRAVKLSTNFFNIAKLLGMKRIIIDGSPLDLTEHILFDFRPAKAVSYCIFADDPDYSSTTEYYGQNLEKKVTIKDSEDKDIFIYEVQKCTLYPYMVPDLTKFIHTEYVSNIIESYLTSFSKVEEILDFIDFLNKHMWVSYVYVRCTSGVEDYINLFKIKELISQSISRLSIYSNLMKKTKTLDPLIWTFSSSKVKGEIHLRLEALVTSLLFDARTFELVLRYTCSYVYACINKLSSQLNKEDLGLVCIIERSLKNAFEQTVSTYKQILVNEQQLIFICSLLGVTRIEGEGVSIHVHKLPCQ